MPAAMPQPTVPPASSPPRPPDAAQLRRLLQLALPDKGHGKAAGWWQQTDFLLTRSHVDADGDVFLDGVFLSIWKRWDFWLALPGSAPRAPDEGWLARASAWARSVRMPAAAQGVVRQYRACDPHGEPGAWQLLDAARAPAAWAAFSRAWEALLAYWDAAEDERRQGRPARAALHAALQPTHIAALVALPLFTEQYNDWSDPDRAGLWLGDVWAGAHAGGVQGGARHPAALKLSWRNGQEMPGDPEDDAHASYQIEVLPPGAPPPAGTAHPPGLAVSYRQRQGDARQPLPAHAVAHLRRLAQLFLQVQAALLALDARARRQDDEVLLDRTPAPALARLPPYAAPQSDAEALGAGVLALSHAWQDAARAHAAALRARWETDAASDTSAPARDARARQAGAVLRLMRQAQQLGDAGLSERLHHRFAFAPTVFAAHAAQHGQAVAALAWQPDGGLRAWVRAPQGPRCWQLPAGGWQVWPDGAASGHSPGGAGGLVPAHDGAGPAILSTPEPSPARVWLHGVDIGGDVNGDLHGVSEDGAPLWRHHLGGAIVCLRPAPHDSDLLAVGTAAGYLVLLRKGAAPLAHQPATSRWHELRRVLFWDDLPAPLVW
ncbi:hypothetical protein SAMN05428957_105249 [Oryzisolibacter propanilivorax]|uniref:Uncharacterized protein n=2 Tax=Oryzisolibacter propanilivorax TaxID=1527607 RepID=A0A1G9SZY7_9BURK|nr:hypothetical protein SAMN05428957_105249 [Oryzisolibacter propanilivorax]